MEGARAEAQKLDLRSMDQTVFIGLEAREQPQAPRPDDSSAALGLRFEIRESVGRGEVGLSEAVRPEVERGVGPRPVPECVPLGWENGRSALRLEVGSVR